MYSWWKRERVQSQILLNVQVQRDCLGVSVTGEHLRLEEMEHKKKTVKAGPCGTNKESLSLSHNLSYWRVTLSKKSRRGKTCRVPC